MVQPTPEMDAFIRRIEALPTGPGVSLDGGLQPSLDEETELRKLFANDRQNARIANPYVGLVDIFAAPKAIRTTRARVVGGKEELSSKYVMPIAEMNRRKEGSHSVVDDLEQFKKNWAIFSEGTLVQLLDWNNVVAAGGSVLACLTPLDEDQKATRRSIRKYYHSQVYSTSDIDLFLWGLTAEQAEVKIKRIYEAVRDSVPWDVTCIRTKHTISIHSQYPHRSVQIILRLYHSPAEILAGFDVDAPCCAYDGNRVWANPRAIVAMMRQCNTVDVTRRSPSYEVRLAKYSRRLYEVYIPSLSRDKIDPTIFERNIAKVKGLARLLVLEKLKNDEMRISFLSERRELRARPWSSYRASKRNRRKYKGDLKQETGISVEMNDYDVTSLHIPYGPGWDSRRIDKLVYQTDLGMNSNFNPKNKGRRLHRHPAFFGNIEEVMEDCCEYCPAPIDDDEKELQKKEDEVYVRGRIQFVEENPGRQSMTGSFKPIDEGEWSEQAYIKPAAKFFQAIISYDRVAVQHLLEEDEGKTIVHQRDHVGRTALHVAILVKAVDIAEDLVDAGARITAKLTDGRTPLHLAAQYDLPRLVKKLIVRSEKNKLELEGQKGKDEAVTGDLPGRPSSEDDWSSHDDEDVVMSASEDEKDDNEGVMMSEVEDNADSVGGDDNVGDDGEGEYTAEGSQAVETAQSEQGDVLEDETDEPDVIDVNIHDWDFGFTPLCYAVVFGSLPTIEALLTAGADVKLPTNVSSGNYIDTSFHPLTLTLIREDDTEACSVVEFLLKAGATSTTADDHIRTIFHNFVAMGRTRLVDSILRCDPSISTVINLPYLQGRTAIFPVVTAVQKRHYATLVLLLAHGARLDIQESDITKAVDVAPEHVKRSASGYSQVQNYLQIAYQPLEPAVKSNDDIAQLLITLGASIDFGLKHCLEQYSNESQRVTIRDCVDFGVQGISETIKDEEMDNDIRLPAAQPPESFGPGWLGYLRAFEYSTKTPQNPDVLSLDLNRKRNKLQDLRDIRAFLVEVQAALSERKAKTWNEAYPGVESTASTEFQPKSQVRNVDPPAPTGIEREFSYHYLSGDPFRDNRRVPEHLLGMYDDLYEACYNGGNEKIRRLCLPDPGEAATAPGAPEPLNISVLLLNKGISRYTSSGYTPLFAAIANKQWSTAKLILAIATAQYSPDKDDEKVEFDSNVMDDDSDTKSVSSDGSDITIEQQKVVFVDIASRPSKVTSNVHPRQLLNTTTSWRKQLPAENEPPLLGPQVGEATPIVWAIVQHDLEAFMHIATLYRSLTQPVPLLDPSLLHAILQHDQAEMLDEYIKRTGDGINIPAIQKSSETEPAPVATNDENKFYLGLSIHRKKRIDLAKKNDPNAAGDDDTMDPPLLWRAIREKASAVITYLASERPLAAYRHYASTNSDSKAIFFKRLGIDKGGELEKRLPSWLGWTLNGLGESPLSAAILGDDLNLIQSIAKLDPKLMTQCLQLEIKFLGFNLLLLAISVSDNVKIMEYLLSRNISPDHKDARGWNIYHFICSKNKVELLKYFLGKLPRDLNELLLVQSSLLRRNTPLHLAVKGGYDKIISILLDYSKHSLLIRDIDGQTPLHSAVSYKFPLISKRLLDDMGLSMENGVGNTPMEVISLLGLFQRLVKLEASVQREESLYYVDYSSFSDTPRIPADQIFNHEAELKDLGYVARVLIDQGVVPDAEKKKLKNEVGKWVSKMEGIVNAAKELEATREIQRERAKGKQKKISNRDDLYPPDVGDVSETFAILKEAFESRSAIGVRQLIHLDDVQTSVSYTLAHVNPDVNEDGNSRCQGKSRCGRTRGSDDEPADDAEEDKAKSNSMVFQIIGLVLSDT